MDKLKRSCGTCTKCCEGWLTGEAHGKKFAPGTPCHFKSATGCAIYDERPENPCKTFACQWLIDEQIPEWMKPDIVDLIILKRKYDEHDVVELIEAGSKLDSRILSWFFMHWVEGRIDNLKYSINGGANLIHRNTETKKEPEETSEKPNE